MEDIHNVRTGRFWPGRCFHLLSMSKQLLNADTWWAGLLPEEKAFFHKLLELAEELLDGQVLRLSFNGRSYCPELYAEHRPRLDRSRMHERFGPMEDDPDNWWAGLSAEKRQFVLELVKLMRQVELHRNEYLEMRNTGHSFELEHTLQYKD